MRARLKRSRERCGGEAGCNIDRAADHRGPSKRGGGGGAETETESAKTGWGIDAKAFVRWLPRLASTVVGSARTMQGASHDELNWCCAALPRRLDDHLAKQVESWSWPNRGAKSTG